MTYLLGLLVSYRAGQCVPDPIDRGSVADPNPDPLVGSMDPDRDPALDPDPSISKQK